MRESLQQLGVDYVDVLFLHDPLPNGVVPAELGTWLEARRQAGVIREYGASGDLHAMSSLLKTHSALRRVTQFASDPLTNRRLELTPLASEGVVNFSCVANVLARLKASIDFQSLSESTKRETLSRIAAGCASHSVAANHTGVTLISSTDPARLKQLVSAGTAGPTQADPAHESPEFAEWMRRLGAQQLSKTTT